MAYKHSALVIENKKLRDHNARLLSLLKTEDDISWYDMDDDEKLNDIFPDKEDEWSF